MNRVKVMVESADRQDKAGTSVKPAFWRQSRRRVPPSSDVTDGLGSLCLRHQRKICNGISYETLVFCFRQQDTTGDVMRVLSMLRSLSPVYRS